MSTLPAEVFSSYPIPSVLCSRRRRTFAFLIDGALLGIAGHLVCLPFFDQLSHLGALATMLGTGLSIAYFGLFNSSMGLGQTPGQRVLQLRVADAQGQPLDLERSFLRAAIFAIPALLGSVSLPLSRTPVLLQGLLTVVSASVYLAIFYLLLFNRETGQGLHDLAAGSYVINAYAPTPGIRRTIWPTHFVILAALLGLLAVGTLFLDTVVRRVGVFPALMQDLTVVEAVRGVDHANVVDASGHNSGDASARQTLIVTVMWTGKADQIEDVAYDVASRILAADPKAHQYDSIRVVVTRGYDIGIASSWVSQTFTHTPAGWE